MVVILLLCPSEDLDRVSARLCVEELGVACAEPAGDCPEEAAAGEAVPEDESPFFLVILFPSLARESCSC